MKIMNNSEEVKFRRTNLLHEVITPEQRGFEESGLVFIANFDPKKDKQWIKSARKGWQGIREGNAYDRNGKPLASLRALYGLPWYR